MWRNWPPKLPNSATERKITAIAQFKVIQGHLLWHTNRWRATSYVSIIVTCRLSCTVFEIWRIIGLIFAVSRLLGCALEILLYSLLKSPSPPNREIKGRCQSVQTLASSLVCLVDTFNPAAGDVICNDDARRSGRNNDEAMKTCYSDRRKLIDLERDQDDVSKRCATPSRLLDYRRTLLDRPASCCCCWCCWQTNVLQLRYSFVIHFRSSEAEPS